jgi:hypothetical protein
MPVNTYGLTTLTFSVPTLTGYVVQAFTKTATSGVVTEIQDSNGKIVTRRHDDYIDELVVEAIFRGATLPAVGALFTYDGASYETMTVETSGQNNEFRRIVLTGRRSEYV